MSVWSVLATSLLPPGEVRYRYRSEFDSELAELRGWQRSRHGLALALAAPRLHQSLVEAGALAVPHSPLWCRVHLRHRWHVVSTEDGSRYRRCLACGLDHDGTMDSHLYGGYGITMHGVTPG